MSGGWGDYGRWVLSLHQLMPVVPGRMPMCSCGEVAVTCPYRRRAQALGLPDGICVDLPAVVPAPRVEAPPGWWEFEDRTGI